MGHPLRFSLHCTKSSPCSPVAYRTTETPAKIQNSSKTRRPPPTSNTLDRSADPTQVISPPCDQQNNPILFTNYNCNNPTTFIMAPWETTTVRGGRTPSRGRGQGKGPRTRTTSPVKGSKSQPQAPPPPRMAVKDSPIANRLAKAIAPT